MTISAFDLYKIGIGPSSSHTVGPMRAANTFVTRLATDGLLTRTAAVRAEMFGSLGVTGHGHGTVKAVVLGLEGEKPDLVDPEAAEPRVAEVHDEKVLRLGGEHADRVLDGRRPRAAPPQAAAVPLATACGSRRGTPTGTCC